NRGARIRPVSPRARPNPRRLLPVEGVRPRGRRSRDCPGWQRYVHARPSRLATADARTRTVPCLLRDAREEERATALPDGHDAGIRGEVATWARRSTSPTPTLALWKVRFRISTDRESNGLASPG